MNNLLKLGAVALGGWWLYRNLMPRYDFRGKNVLVTGGKRGITSRKLQTTNEQRYEATDRKETTRSRRSRLGRRSLCLVRRGSMLYWRRRMGCRICVC